MRFLVVALVLIAIALPVSAQWPNDPAANLPICTNLYLHSYPDAVSDGSGGAILVWEDFRSGSNSYDIYAQRVTITGSVLWTVNGIAMTSAPNEQTLPQVATDGQGGAIVVWLDNEGGGEPDIFAQRVTSAGNVAWQPDGIPICDADDAQTDFDVVPDGAGGVIVTWMDRRNGSHADIYAQRLTPNGTAFWTANGILLCGASDNQEWPRVVGDGVDGVSVVWVDHRGTSADIYAQRLSPSGNLLWSEDGIAVCNASGSQQVPTPVSVAGSPGTIVVSWVDERNIVSGPDIFAQRVDASGATEWVLNGVPVCVAPNLQSRTASLALSDGSVIICWPDSRSDSNDLYASRIDAGGIPLWSSNGVPISVAPNSSWEPQIVTDGQDGAIIVWTDDRNDQFDPDVFAQRINSTGSPIWPINGVAVSTAAFHQHRVRALTDESGGAIIAWEDWRDGGFVAQRYKIFAQRIGSDGNLGPPTSVGSSPTPEIDHLNISPNPFTRETTLNVTLGRASALRIEVFDVAGRRVLTQFLPEFSAGTQRVPLTVTDRNGRSLASGVYLCRVFSSSGSRVVKLVIAR